MKLSHSNELLFVHVQRTGGERSRRYANYREHCDDALRNKVRGHWRRGFE